MPVSGWIAHRATRPLDPEMEITSGGAASRDQAWSRRRLSLDNRLSPGCQSSSLQETKQCSSQQADWFQASEDMLNPVRYCGPGWDYIG